MNEFERNLQRCADTFFADNEAMSNAALQYTDRWRCFTKPRSIALRANDVKVTNLHFLSECYHFLLFNEKCQTKMKNSLMLVSVCMTDFRVYK